MRLTIVSNRKACESPFSSSPLRLRGFRLVRQQRQDKYRVWYSVKPLVVARVHVAERFPADKLLTASWDCYTTSWLILWCEFQDHAALSGNANKAFPKGLFLRERLIFCNESPTNENETFVNAFHRPRLLLLCGLSFVRGNYKRGEQRTHQNGKGERWEVEKKHFCTRFSKGKRRE